MRAMKDSGIEWIGEIPEGWELCKIKNRYKLIVGFTPDTSKSHYYDNEEGYTWVTIADMNDSIRQISDSKTKISNFYISSNQPKKVKSGSLLYSFKLSIGKVCFAEEDLYTNEAIASFQNDDSVCLPYLFYVAFLIEKNANTNIYGAKILNQDLINNSITIFPPLSEQQAIADYLDKKCASIDSIIEKERQVIEKLTEYRKSVITEAVTKGLNPDVPMKDSGIEWIGEIPEGWDVQKIKYVAQINPSESKNRNYKGGDEIGYVPMECVKNGFMMPKSILYEKIPSGLTYFEEGDIVLAKVTPCFENGNISIANNLVNKVAYGSSELIVFRCTNINTEFLFYFLQNKVFKQHGIATMTGTGGLKRVSTYFLQNYVFPIPPLSEQQAIADYLDKKCASIDDIIAKKHQLIDKLTEYKKSLIYEMVTGKKEVPLC